MELKVLFYNWVAFDDERLRGGGVTAYLNNLIEYLILHHPEIKIYFLSSGSYCDIYDTTVRYEKIGNIWGEKCHTYSIINSPVFAPAYLSFFQLKNVLDNRRLADVVTEFLKKEGPFDVVHFHNLEGLSLNVLSIKQYFPFTKFIYSLHNYYPFCPQVNLWKNEECNCKLRNTGKECIKCLRQHVPVEKLQRKMSMSYYQKKNPSEKLKKAYFQCGKRLDDYYYDEEHRNLLQQEEQQLFDCLDKYRDCFIEQINQNIDIVLAVSKRVKEIAEKMGIMPEKVYVSYIGTKAAELQLKKDYTGEKDYISIIYMGYQRKDKGFFFLLKVLEQLDIEVAKKINLTIAAKKLPEYPEVVIDKGKFRSVHFQNGYERKEISGLLKGQDLGIVPSLWEDNLPQVAIEMAGHGVPVLASDRGGASELCSDERFRFCGGDINDCADKITGFVNNPNMLQLYWKKFQGLMTLKKHAEELMMYYGKQQ